MQRLASLGEWEARNKQKAKRTRWQVEGDEPLPAKAAMSRGIDSQLKCSQRRSSKPKSRQIKDHRQQATWERLSVFPLSFVIFGQILFPHQITGGSMARRRQRHPKQVGSSGAGVRMCSWAQDWCWPAGGRACVTCAVPRGSRPSPQLLAGDQVQRRCLRAPRPSLSPRPVPNQPHPSFSTREILNFF